MRPSDKNLEYSEQYIGYIKQVTYLKKKIIMNKLLCITTKRTSSCIYVYITI